MPEDEIKAALAALTARLDVILNGCTDAHNVYHPGVLPTQASHERRLCDLEETFNEAERQRLNWRHAAGLLFVGGGLNAFAKYILDHVK